MRPPPSQLGLIHFPPERITGDFYAAGPWGVPNGGNGTVTRNKLFAIPFWVGDTQTFDRLQVNCTSNVATAVMRLGLYNDGGGKPSTLIIDAGTVNMASGTGAVSITINQTLVGLVWVAAVMQTADAQTSRMGAGVASPLLGVSDTYSVGFVVNAYSQTGITGALPDPWGSTYTTEVATNTVPWVWLRAS